MRDLAEKFVNINNVSTVSLFRIQLSISLFADKKIAKSAKMERSTE